MRNEMRFDHSKLEDLMVQRGLRQCDVCAVTGLVPSQVNDLLRRKVESPRQEVVTRLSEGLGVDWLFFYGRDVHFPERAS